jgi:hypothetical protein
MLMALKIFLPDHEMAMIMRQRTLQKQQLACVLLLKCLRNLMHRFPITCNVGEGKFHYYFGGNPNPYWFMFTISNTRWALTQGNRLYPISHPEFMKPRLHFLIICHDEDALASPRHAEWM